MHNYRILETKKSGSCPIFTLQRRVFKLFWVMEGWSPDYETVLEAYEKSISQPEEYSRVIMPKPVEDC